MRFIYFCENDAGIKTTFLSRACLEPGMRIPADDGTTTTIVDMQLEKNISMYEDAERW